MLFYLVADLDVFTDENLVPTGLTKFNFFGMFCLEISRFKFSLYRFRWNMEEPMNKYSSIGLLESTVELVRENG